MGRVRRRQFLIAAGVLLAAASNALAQNPEARRRIGVLSAPSENSVTGNFIRRALPEGLRQHGFQEGGNLVIEWRWAEGKPERLDALAGELVRTKVELIVVLGGHFVTEAAKRATVSIPIVMHAVPSPVEVGLVASLARPGGNITGTSWAGVEIVEKLFQILRDALPRAERVAVMRNPATVDARLYMDAYERAAGRLGMAIQYFFVTRPEEIAVALERIDAARPDALLVAFNPVISPHERVIGEFATKRKLFLAGTTTSIVEAGGLLTYQPDREAIMVRTASYVDRILRGAKPANLPVELPTKYELVINARAARAIGYTVPQSLLMRADRVIE